MMNSRLPIENADTVSLVCALLARFPELTSIRSLLGEGTLRLTFAVKQRLDRAAQALLAEAIDDHASGFHALSRGEYGTLRVDCESDRGMTFVHVTRDRQTFCKEELDLMAAFFAERFGEALVRTPVEPDRFEEDIAAADEAASYAVEALRDPTQSKSLVGFREESHVLVYFLKSRKKAKASTRR